MARSPLNSTTQPVDIKEEGRNSTMAHVKRKRLVEDCLVANLMTCASEFSARFNQALKRVNYVIAQKYVDTVSHFFRQTKTSNFIEILF